MTDHCEICGGSESHDVCTPWDDASRTRFEAHAIWLSLPHEPEEVTEARRAALDRDTRDYVPRSPRARYDKRRWLRYHEKHSTGREREAASG